MTKFINPFTDVGFKKIFGQEMTKDLLIDFLNDLLVDEKHIIDITFLDKEILPEYMGDRGVIYDIYCITESGEQFIVEMQNKQHVHFRERALYYLSKTVARQGEKGAEWKFDLKAVYGVFFMNFRLDNLPHKLRTDVVLTDRDTHEQFSDKLRFIFIELPAFSKEEQECETDFERWIYVLKNMNLFDMSPLKEKEAHFRRLLDVANLGALTPQERAIYDENLKIYRDWKATMEYAVENAEAKGEVRGSRLITLRTALNLKRIGLDPSVIAQCTGLSLEEINDLENLIRKEEIKC